jgi:uncharacterized protein (TIGR02145 family)
MKTGIKLFAVVFIISGLLLLTGTGCHDKNKTVVVPLEYSSVTDIDGNIYKTVKIANQWWMAENLKVTKYQDGSPIINVPKFQDATWDTTHSGARCLYDDNVTAPGLLYNWSAVTDGRRIAPVGWHVPSDEEWKTLEESIGMPVSEANKTSWRGTNEAEKLKIEAPKGWTTYSSIWGTNESGFAALAGSCRLSNGTWGDPGLFSTGFWWSATPYQGGQAWYRYLDYKNANIFRSHVLQNYGCSIRCVKD